VPPEDQFQNRNTGPTYHPSPLQNNTSNSVGDIATTEIPSSTTIPTEFPNNEKTHPLFWFRNYGHKSIKDAGKQKYYRCNDEKCSAKYTLTDADTSGSPTQVRTFSPEAHNHHPSPNPAVDPEVKEHSISHLRVGASPANVHKHLVQEAPFPLSSADVPTPGMLRKWKHRDAYKDMESSMFTCKNSFSSAHI
jgi:hypothetical protein